LRQIVLDTETTGLEPDMGHRIIEIGAVEVIDRKLTGQHFHKYINPEREIDDGAFEVHGISQTFLADKPVFVEIWEEFVDYVRGAELVIHNAPFDVSFLEYELRKIAGAPRNVTEICSVHDSLALARKKHPGQKNNLDALCRRYEVDNSQRQLHGALLDAEILADVYLLMTGGQTSLFGQVEQHDQSSGSGTEGFNPVRHNGLKIGTASSDERAAHEEFMQMLTEKSDAEPVWERLDS